MIIVNPYSFYSPPPRSDELFHHGIKDQKWGHMNGPPYPLGASDHSVSEKKAGWRSSLKKSSQTDSNQNHQRKGLSDKQKRALKIGAAAVGVALVAGGTAYAIKSGKFDNVLSKGNLIAPKKLPGDAGSVSNLKKSFNDLSIGEKVQAINPLHIQNNCKECSLAFAKSEISGKIVQAKEKSVVGNLFDFAKREFNINPETNKACLTLSGDSGNIQARVERQLLKRFSEGDIGAVNIDFHPKYIMPGVQESGHTFTWKIADGTVHFIDSQGNKDGNLKDPTEWFKLIRSDRECLIVNYSRLLRS